MFIIFTYTFDLVIKFYSAQLTFSVPSRFSAEKSFFFRNFIATLVFMQER